MVLRNRVVEQNTPMISELSTGGEGQAKARLGSLSTLCMQLGPRKLSIIRSSGVSAVQGIGKY